MSAMLYDSPRRRRLLMPIVILLIGGGIALWSSQQQSKRSEEIRQAAVTLCRDVHAGHQVSQRVQGLTAAPNPTLQTALERACLSAKNADDISVHVTAGDVKDGSAFAGAATHIAMIQINGADALGLRVRHHGDDRPIEILGHFLPR